MANIMDMLGVGRVITIDPSFQPPRPDQPDRPSHPRITYLKGLSTDPAIVDQVKGAINPSDKVMVVLDSDHTYPNVMAELNVYSSLVSETFS